MKQSGNEFYVQKNYTEALSCYTQAINLCPTCASYYGNRSACYMMLNKYTDALDDARMSTRIDDKFVKGYLREGKCHIALGDPPAAIRIYNMVLQLEKNNSQAKTELEIAQ